MTSRTGRVSTSMVCLLAACASRMSPPVDGAWSDAPSKGGIDAATSVDSTVASSPPYDDGTARYDGAPQAVDGGPTDLGTPDAMQCTPDEPCTTQCGSTGRRRCGGTPICTEPVEQCNGADDDCDGLLDNGVDASGRDTRVGRSWGRIQIAGTGDGDYGILRRPISGRAAFSLVRVRGEAMTHVVSLFDSPGVASASAICARSGGGYDVLWSEVPASTLTPSSLWYARVTNDDRAPMPHRVYQSDRHFIAQSAASCAEDGSWLLWLEHDGSTRPGGGCVRCG